MRKVYNILIASLVFISTANGQSELWTKSILETDIWGDYSVTYTIGNKLFFNDPQVKLFLFQSGLDYKLNKRVSLIFDHRITLYGEYTSNSKDYYYHRNRLGFEMNQKKKKFHFNYRFLIQTNDYILSNKKIEITQNLIQRNRVEIEFIKKKLKFRPYMSSEVFLKYEESLALDRLRLKIGSKYYINKYLRINLGYGLNQDYSNTMSNNTHLILLSIRLDFRI